VIAERGQCCRWVIRCCVATIVCGLGETTRFPRCVRREFSFLKALIAHLFRPIVKEKELQRRIH
jgi:hypothetical protein